MTKIKDRLCFGNWKLNKNLDEAKNFISEFSALVSKDEKEHFAFFPQSLIAGAFVDSGLHWGPQNVYSLGSGAFTGETSVKTAVGMGAQYALIGHSERRSLFLESDEFLNQKVKLCLESNTTPVFCIGESLKEKEEQRTFEVLEKQIASGLKNVDLSNVILAYEPVWAIGTGVSATPDVVLEVHDFLKDLIKNDETPILYGGSVKPSNAKELYQINNVDGFLIGGASLDPKILYSVFCEMGEKK